MRAHLGGDVCDRSHSDSGHSVQTSVARPRGLVLFLNRARRSEDVFESLRESQFPLRTWTQNHSPIQEGCFGRALPRVLPGQILGFHTQVKATDHQPRRSLRSQVSCGL